LRTQLSFAEYAKKPGKHSRMNAGAVSTLSSSNSDPLPERQPEDPRKCMSEIKFRVETAFESLTEFRETWDEAVIRLGGTIYMSYDWSRIWWKFYGANKELRIFIFTLENEVIGIVPLYIDSLGVWPIRLKVARIVGANVPPKVFDPPIDERWAEVIFRHVIDQIFEIDGCDLLSFGPVSELHQPTKALLRVSREKKALIAGSEVVSGGVHSVFQLPASLEAYFESLSKSERKKRQYELRLLRKTCDLRVDTVSDPGEVEMEFRGFAEQHSSQWRADGKPGHFGAWPKAKEFNESLVQAHGALGRVRFSRIFADGEPASSQYIFAFGNSYFWELPARAMGAKWDRLSLGPAGAISMIEAAIREGKTRVEGGMGHYDYKVKLGAQEHAVKTLRLLANRGGARLRMAVFKMIRTFVLYAYHKIWYRRMTPRLPEGFRGPQWQVWLRLDF
jgi:CelD/BcsL family acetyltransferase involved in cellulose biosynthesis